jgi:hypothetical protein
VSARGSSCSVGVGFGLGSRGVVSVGVFRVAPVGGETTWSFMSRVAGCYGLEADVLAGHWRWLNHRPRHRGGVLRADADVVLDAAGRQMSVELCVVGEEVLGRALPSWGREEGRSRRVGFGRGAKGVGRWWGRRRSGVDRARRGVPGRRCGWFGMRRAGSGCVCGTRGGPWTRTPMGFRSIWGCVRCRRSWWRGGGGRLWRGGRCGPGWNPWRCSGSRGRWCVGGGSRR